MKKTVFIFFLLSITTISSLYAQKADKEIYNALNPYIENGDIGGIVGIVANGEKILSITKTGYQDVENSKKIDENSLFWIASQSKPITACAVMMLVDEGKLNLDEPITTYLPELTRMVVARVWREGWQVEEKLTKPITLRHLLSHTSGMQWVTSVNQQAGKIDILPMNLALYATPLTPLWFEPGEKYSYSNQGVNVAATIVERVSGMKFEDFLQKRLFEPIGMPSATFYPTEKQLEKLTKAYKMGENKNLEEIRIDQLQYPLSDKNKRFAEAAGGLFCTPSDLVKFYQMFANKGVYNGIRYLSEASVAEISRRQTPDNVPDSYGLCCTENNSWYGHGGAYGTDTRVYRSGYVVMYFIQEAGLPKSGEAHNKFFDLATLLYNIQ
ncbi:serine hydrolase [Parabacteroides sp. Marseille-P3160]|uniref:serine hydrolase domain-containing protein n=1 Tax=Parabacteroides sp. Marseille-P3160 TaxID=1917887 RepID=UPI0009B96A68|nr:serine hydrolase domain-containing protein [Parabacteroides sp. Marseille-P3160]